MVRDPGWLKARLEETRRLRQYSSRVEAVAKRIEVDVDRLVKLDANENLFIPRALLSQALKELAEDLDPRLYPRGEKAELVERIGEYLALPTEYVVVGNSSDEFIETAVRVFLRSGEEAITIEPTFVMYRIIVNTHGNRCIEVPLRDDFSLDAEAILAETTSSTVLCFLCSPNNPTGNQLEVDSIRRIVEEFKGVVVVDEAYAEFASYSVKDAVKRFENLIVLRTFSKAFGLAGLRIGYAVACPGLASALRRIQLPFNINKVSLRMASKVLERRKIFDEAVERLKAERGRLTERLNGMAGVRAFDSEANFVLFRTVGEADYVFEGLMRRGVLVRDIGNVLNYGRCFRVTVGPPEMNGKFLDALEDTLAGEGS